MDFTTGRTYRFNPKNQKDTPRSGHRAGNFKMAYLRRVGWLESFTREQLEDHEITEIRV